MSEKSEKLYDGITNIREELVEQVEKKKKPAWKRWGIRSAAAVLALVFVLGALLDPAGGGGGTVASAYAIAEAEYPKMAQYPKESGDPGSREYKAWQKDVDAQKQQAGYADGLGNYFIATVRQFLSGAEAENVVYSPLNVYMALAMLAELTDGSSRQQILDLLGSEGIENLRQQATAVWNAQYRDDGIVSRILGSSVWLNENVNFVQSTMDTLADTYYASSYRGRMGTAEFDQALRDWLNAQTGGLLEESISGETLPEDAILALATTIYYKGKWSSKFSESKTTQDIFHASSGDVTCDFMHQSTQGVYYWGEKFSAVRRFMDGGSMWFLLPDEGYAPEALLADAETAAFMETVFFGGAWENSKRLEINQSIPKFDVISSIELQEGLMALGITEVFDGTADFSPMTQDIAVPVAVSKAMHNARVIIDEEGVEAAAYTVMVNSPTSAAPSMEEIDFVVDRPFLFLITGADGLPLFAGVVNNP